MVLLHYQSIWTNKNIIFSLWIFYLLCNHVGTVLKILYLSPWDESVLILKWLKKAQYWLDFNVTNFFVTPWISFKLNHNGKGHVLPTLIQFHVRRTNIVKVTFNRNSGRRLAPDTHFTAASWKSPPACPESAHTSCLSSWTPTKHFVTVGSYSKCMWQATETAFLWASSVLC